MKRLGWFALVIVVVAVWITTLDGFLAGQGVDRLLFWRTSASALLSGITWHIVLLFLEDK